MKKVYAHFRIDNMGTLHHSGGVTVYGEWEPETGQLTAMGAVCTLEDNYNYKRGRAIAEGRFKRYSPIDQSSDRSINVPRSYRAETGEEVHNALGWVANDLSSHLKIGFGGAVRLRRYYRSVGSFEEKHNA